MTALPELLPVRLREMLESRVASVLSRMRAAFQRSARTALLQRQFTATGFGARVIEREQAGAGELRARAIAVWDIYTEALARAGIDNAIPILSALLLTMPGILSAERGDIASSNRESIQAEGESVTNDYLDHELDAILDDLRHSLMLAELSRETQSSTSLLALSAPRYVVARAHWEKASGLRRGDEPDLENAVKESILAVEALAKSVLGLPKATLGDCLKHDRLVQVVDPGLRKLINVLWGYTSNAPGVRHSGSVPPGLAAAEADFAIETCAATLRLFLALDTQG
jgi:hypothetical protein